MSAETIYKLKLIKKYAKIRFRRFWREWGVSKEEAGIFLEAFLMFVSFFMIYILGAIIL